MNYATIWIVNNYTVSLNPPKEMGARLGALQAVFSKAVQLAWEVGHRNDCASRIALHHLAYESIRRAEPKLGAQLACNAIYLASAYLKLAKNRLRQPLLASGAKKPDFSKVPVHFDKHTLTIKNDVLSIYTLDGRARLSLTLPDDLQHLLLTVSVKEILLIVRQEKFFLMFIFKTPEANQSQSPLTVIPKTDAFPMEQAAL